MMLQRELLRDRLASDEGSRARPYRDSVGKLTIGVGRNLDDVGLSEDEIDLLLDNDIDRAERSAHLYHWFKALDGPRQGVVLCMIFNLGAVGFSEFRRLLQAISEHSYARAADEMMSSKWAQQVGLRAVRLAGIMRTGVWT